MSLSFLYDRCTEKILSQLEHHTEKIIATQNRNGYHTKKYAISTNRSETSHISNHLSDDSSNVDTQSLEVCDTLKTVSMRLHGPKFCMYSFVNN